MMIRANKTVPYRAKKRGKIIGTITRFRKGQTINGEKLLRGSVIHTPHWSQQEYWFESPNQIKIDKK